MKKSRGFTLIEVLIVVLIIGIVITTTLLSLQRFLQTREVLTAAKQLELIIPVVQRRAVLQLAVFGLRINRNSYAFYRFRVNTNGSAGTWQLVSRDRVLANTQLAPGLELTLITPQAAPLIALAAALPQLIFFPSGEMTSFKLIISTTKRATRYALSTQANGNLLLTTAPAST